jgi:hypothetical protein
MKLELTFNLAKDAVLGYPRLGFWLDPYLDTDNTLVGYGIVFTHNGTTIYDPTLDECLGNPIDPMGYYGIAPGMAMLLRAHNFEYMAYRGFLAGSQGESSNPAHNTAEVRFRYVKHAIQAPLPIKAAEFLPLLGFSEYHTGGGCMAYQWYDSQTDEEILVTEHEGSTLPDYMCHALVGWYKNVQEGTDAAYQEYFMPQYQREFPRFGEMDVPIPSGWEDSSWHNDICPSFRVRLDEAYALRIAVDFKDPNEREHSHGHRFSLDLYDKDEEWQETILTTDDWDKVLATVKDRQEIAKGLNLTGSGSPTRVTGMKPEVAAPYGTVWIATFGSRNYEFTAVGLTEQEARDTMKKLLHAHTVQLNLRPDWYSLDDVNCLEAKIGAGYRDYSELRLDDMHMGRRLSEDN